MNKFTFTSRRREGGFVLMFGKDCDTKWKDFLMSRYKLVEEVKKEKHLDCESCFRHIGTAPNIEHCICTHPVLGITQCLACYNYYVRLEFFLCSFQFHLNCFFDRHPEKLRKRGERNCTAVGAVMAGRSTSVHRDLTSFALNASSII